MTRKEKNSTYDLDFQRWCSEQYIAVGNRDIENIDFDNLKEELLDLGKTERNALRSYIKIIMIHLLKFEVQPDYIGSRGWESSIYHSRSRIEDILINNPSLKKKLSECIRWGFERARQKASNETGIDLYQIRSNPFTIQEIIGG